MKAFPTLYARNSNGKINQWTVEAYSTEPVGVMITEGIMGGTLTNSHRKSKGKNIGKMNETSAYQQAIKDAESRWNDKKKKGYKSLEDLNIVIQQGEGEAVNLENLIDLTLPMVRTDANSLNKPMKCQPYFKDDGSVRISFPCYGQPKLNGFRVFARWEEVMEGEGLLAQKVEKVVFRSKEGLMYTGLEHIEEQFTKEMFKVTLGGRYSGEEIDIVYDGEMYCHGMKLQDIASATKKKNSNTAKLKFNIFDLAVPKLTQKARLELLCDLMIDRIITLKEHSNLSLVLHGIVQSDEEAQKLTDTWIANGFEGGVFRDMGAHYQFGSRPRTMVKLKRTEDADFPIVDVVGGENAPDLGIFVCVTKEGEQFKVNPDASHEERKEYLINKQNYIGKKLQLKFYEWTKDKKPFHIKECVVRDYE